MLLPFKQNEKLCMHPKTVDFVWKAEACFLKPLKQDKPKYMAKSSLTRNKEQGILGGWKGKSWDNSVKQLEKKTGLHEIRRVIFGEGGGRGRN